MVFAESLRFEALAQVGAAAINVLLLALAQDFGCLLLRRYWDKRRVGLINQADL
jgi:hypothetical protein